MKEETNDQLRTTPPAMLRCITQFGVMCNKAEVLLAPKDGIETVQGEALKKSSELWFMHGAYYDLSLFMKNHPGGEGVLKMTQGLEDVTALFESYHALANIVTIKEMMEQYRYKGAVHDDMLDRFPSKDMASQAKHRAPLDFTFAADGFYNTLRNRVKTHFLQREAGTAFKNVSEKIDLGKVSVARMTKVTKAWYSKELLIMALYTPCFLTMLGVDFGIGKLTGWDLSIWGWGMAARMVAGLCAGWLLQAFSFCTLHDASHYGLFSRRPALTEALSRVCNAWTLWNHASWSAHHVYGHHSFTGDAHRDPDIIHARPFIRKNIMTPILEYARYFLDWQHIAAPVFFLLIPGQTIGQTLSYYCGVRQGYIWRCPVGDHVIRDMPLYEKLTYILSIGAHFYGGSFFASASYFMGCSVLYHICIAPDHDTFESAVLNCVDRHEVTGMPGNKDEALKDWGTIQVRHSGNFCTSSSLWTQMCGGINFQIEHHLFPSMSHMHYHHIAPIVRTVCREFNVPYVSHPTLWSAYRSYLMNLKFCGANDNSDPAVTRAAIASLEATGLDVSER
ncbi:unnamed protein product [Chrysoparadoxa australica]